MRMLTHSTPLFSQPHFTPLFQPLSRLKHHHNIHNHKRPTHHFDTTSTVMAEETEKKAITLTEGETKLFISIMKNLESDIAVSLVRCHLAVDRSKH